MTIDPNAGVEPVLARCEVPAARSGAGELGNGDKFLAAATDNARSAPNEAKMPPPAKLDAIRIARATGDIPQNVNFAVSEGTVRAFLDAQDVPYETAPSIDSLKAADVAAKARKFTVVVECWK